MKNVGIYDPYVHILGGGERYVFSIADCLSSDFHIILYSQEETLLEKIQDKFGLSLKNISLKPWSTDRKKRNQELSQFDLFFYVTDGSLFRSPAKKNILIIQSPAHIPNLSIVNRFKLFSWSTVICYSEFMAQIIRKRLGKKAYPLFVPISETFTKIPPKEKCILTVGRFFPQLHNKKQLEMVQIFSEMVKEGLKNTTLYVVGSIDPGGTVYFEKVKKAAESLPIKIIVNASKKELDALYSKAKIYWHATGFGEDLINYPEKAEHFGVTTIEAMAKGVVPVVFNAGGQPEIVKNSENGFLWNTKEELKTYTHQIMTNDTLRLKLAQNALKDAKLYQQEIFCEKLKALCNF